MWNLRDHPKDAAWNGIGGVYMFVGPGPNNTNTVYYIGMCDSFKTRLPCHERWDEAAKAGATHVHAAGIADVKKREEVERYLIGHINPPLNTHHTLAEGLLAAQFNLRRPLIR